MPPRFYPKGAGGGGGGLPPIPDNDPYALTAFNGVADWTKLIIAAGSLGPSPLNIPAVPILAAGHPEGLYSIALYLRITVSTNLGGFLIARVNATDADGPIDQDSVALDATTFGVDSEDMIVSSDGTEPIYLEKTGLIATGPGVVYSRSYIRFFLSYRGPF